MTERRLTVVYGALCVVGTVAPLVSFVPWFIDHGLDMRLFAAELFANRISAFFGLDVIVAAIVTVIFVLVQGARDRVPWRWLAIAGTLLVGVSCGLPLFLALREGARRE